MASVKSEKITAENKVIRSYMIDMIIMLSVTVVVAVYTYGIRALESTLLSVFAAVATEAVSYLLFMHKKPERLTDLSAIFTGMAIALALPSSAPLFMAPLGSIVAIAVAKIPFGNAKSVPFVPAAVGLAFLTICYPDVVFKYPSLSVGDLGVSSMSEEFIQGTSLAHMLSQSKSIGTGVLYALDVFVGRVPGPMGASCLILMLGILVYMIIRRQPGLITTVSFIAACGVMAVLFPRVLTGRTYSLLMELSSGLLLYSAVFFISDPVTSPKNQVGKVLYGAVAGIITMLLRYFGAFEESVCFVVIMMNSVSTAFDKLGVRLSENPDRTSSHRFERRTKRKAATEKVSVEDAEILEESDTPSTDGGASEDE